jgi:menaquinone-dependent protoporphyrinogen oxidase
MKPARKFAERLADDLRRRPVWLFSSGPLGPPDALVPPGGPVDTNELISLTGAVGHTVFAGRLEKQRLGRRERAIAGLVHAPEGDCRDWDAIDAFAGEIAEQLAENYGRVAG